MIGRRTVLGLASTAWACGTAASWLAIPSEAHALGRTPVGGKLRVSLPWALNRIDPHDVFDVAGALFGSAICDSLFALDKRGNPYPTLAARMPTKESGGAVVRLRPALRTGRGKPLDSRDVIFSFRRARARGATAVLASLPEPRRHPGDGLAVIFDRARPHDVARALASPATALVPRSFSATAPDGTGAFRAKLSAGRLSLSRNPNAARGASFLDAVDVRSAASLRDSLRAFEAGRDDVGWLGAGLHGARRGARKFDLGVAGWVVLVTGSDGGAFGAPGAAQRLANAVPRNRLAHLGLSSLPPGGGDPAWGGAPTDLFVDAAAPQLVEVAQAVAPILSRPDHEVEVRRVSRSELRRKIRAGAALAIDSVRAIGPAARDVMFALATADSARRGREVGRRPPKLAEGTLARAMTRSLRLGVLGELRVTGAAVADVVLRPDFAGGGWNLGASFRTK